MEKMRLCRAAAFLLAASLLSSAGAYRALADSPPPGSVMALPEEMPYVTLIDSFTLYAGPDTRPEQAVGALSPLQSVRLAPVERDALFSIKVMEKVEVETWLGPVWINLQEGAYQYNKIEWKEETLHLLEKETVLDEVPGRSTPYALGPQQVQAVASIDACQPYSPCYNRDYYYLIHTSWLGDMWIKPYHYAEKYQGTATLGAIPIDREMPVYLFPTEQPLVNEPAVQPQVMTPLAKYMQMGRMAPPIVWYKIKTALGERWILQDGRYGLGVEGVEKVSETLRMPVSFVYRDSPYSTFFPEQERQPPQDLQAIGKHGDWVMVLVNGTGKWVNPSREIAYSLTGEWEHDKALGVKTFNTPIEISETTVVADRPYPDATAQEELPVFSRQSIIPERVWDSPGGTRWYYISTWKGCKWVMLP